MNSWRQPNLLRVAFFSYLITGLYLFMLPWHRDYIEQLCIYLGPSCCLLAILGRWLFIDIRAMVVIAMVSLAYLHQPPVTEVQSTLRQPITLEATVYSVTSYDDHLRLVLGDAESNDGMIIESLNEIRAISSNPQHQLSIGERIRGHGLLEKSGRWLSINKFSYISENEISWLPFHQLRQAVSDRLSTLFSGNELGIAKALILADKSSLDELMRSGYRNFGLLHLLAVSGMHFWLWNALLRRLLGYKLGRLRIPLLVIAALLAGFGPAVSRALGFIVVRDIAAISHRSFSALSLLSIVGMGELLLFENDHFGLGYLLSYTATIAIIVCSDKKNDSALIATMRCSWAAFFATMPLIFHLQSTIEFFSILFSPIFAIFTTARLFIILLSLPLPTQQIAQWLLESISTIELKLISYCDMLPGTPFVATTKSELLITLLTIFALLLATPNAIRRRSMRVCTILIALSCFFYQPTAKVGISMVNVGHGLGTVINGIHTSLGFDLGSQTLRGNRLVDGVYFSELRHNNWPVPNEFIFSHRDADHINGMPALQNRISVVELNHEQALSKTLAPWQVKVFRTRGGLNHTANDNGYAIDLRYAHYRIIVLGDQDGSALFELAQRIEAGPVDIMFSPHHGLSTDGLAMMIEHLRPNEMWGSCSIDNYPLPARPIAEHYGIPMFDTARQPLRYIFDVD